MQTLQAQELQLTHSQQQDHQLQTLQSLVAITVRQQQTINQVHHHLQQQTILQQTITTATQVTPGLCHQHQLQVYLQCHKIFALLVLDLEYKSH